MLSRMASKRSLPDIADDPAPGYDAQEYTSIIASTSTLVASSCNKRAKRAETRECPICGEDIPLRLLGQHYTLESSRVQAILDHIGDLEGFSDPHALAHAPYVNNLFTYTGSTEHVGGYMLMQYLRSMPRRRAAPHLRDAPAAFASRLAKILSSIKRRRKARYIALRDVMRDEDDLSVIGKGKGRATTTAGQCPVCLQDVDGDLDVISAHIDVCLAHAEMQWPASSIGTDADGDASLNTEGCGGEDGSDMWEESETPDGVRRLRLRAGARNGAIALGFAVGDRAVDDVDDEIDVEGDDLSAFGAAQFTEAPVLDRPSDSELSRGDTGRRAAEAEVDLTIERARQGKDSQALIAALERKVQLLMGAPTEGTALGCRICLEVYNEPTVSVGCWHTCCSACWLRCLEATGVCPICKRITGRSDLRRIYL